jgi:hypothetical protein
LKVATPALDDFEVELDFGVNVGVAVVFWQVVSMLCRADFSVVVIVRLYVDLTLTHMLAYVQWYETGEEHKY